jgi:hypothetical protein
MDIHWFSALVVVIGAIYSPLKWWHDFLYKWFTTPTVICYFFDSPNSSEAHYFMIVKPHWSKNVKQNIRIVIEPIVGQVTDYVLTIVPFLRCIGLEHLQEQPINQITQTNCIETLYQLKTNTEYRIIIQVQGGKSGSLPISSYNLNIEAPGARIKKARTMY